MTHGCEATEPLCGAAWRYVQMRPKCNKVALLHESTGRQRLSFEPWPGGAAAHNTLHIPRSTFR
ncbi:hypothetical protein AB870_26430 [Pandoraea faecigallinarum]|nr:hypothetical protein AB870_26430 [Pandoraea faecigallinarum]